MHDSLIEGWQHLGHQHFDGRQPREASAIKHEVVNPHLDERLHLLNYLRRSADKILAHLVPSCREEGSFYLSGSTHTAS